MSRGSSPAAASAARIARRIASPVGCCDVGRPARCRAAAQPRAPAAARRAARHARGFRARFAPPLRRTPCRCARHRTAGKLRPGQPSRCSASRAPRCHIKSGNVDPRTGAAHDHHVGLVAANHVGRFAQRQQRRHVALGNRVVRSAGIVANADVAGRHVRQILQHPQRVQLAHRLPRPAVDIEVLLLDPFATNGIRSSSRSQYMTPGRRRRRRSDPDRASPAASPASCQASSAAAEAS